MKLTAIFQIKLTATNPAPAQVYAFNFSGNTPEELKKSYSAGVADMKATFKQYTHFKRLSVVQDVSDWLKVTGGGVIGIDLEIE